MLYVDVNPWPHSMLGNCNNFSNFSRLQCYKFCKSSYRTLWNTCQLTLTSVNTWPDPYTHYHKLNHRWDIRGRNPYCFNTAIEGEDKTAPSRWLHQKLKYAFWHFTQAEFCLGSLRGLRFFQPLKRHHHHHIPSETGGVFSHGSAGSTTDPACPLERHQAWQFRKAQGWPGIACTRQNTYPLFRSHNDHLVQIPRKSCSCMYRLVYTEFIPCIWVYLYIHSLCRATNPDFLPWYQVGCIGGKKGQQELDQKEPLWERERDNGRNKHKPAWDTFITLLWAKEPRARTHGFKKWLFIKWC